MLDKFSEVNERQVAVESYLVLRSQYRAERLRWVREREDLPEHDGERYMVGGKRVGLVVGKIGVGGGLSTAEGVMRAAAVAESPFEIYVRDPFELAREVVDLERDAGRMEMAGGVEFMGGRTGVEMHPSVLGSDEALDQWMQAALKEME